MIRIVISINASFVDSPAWALSLTTCFAYAPIELGSPRNLRVFDEDISSLKLEWEPAPGRVQHYVVSYQPTEGGETKELSVERTSTELKNLQSGTEYQISVRAHYSSGVTPPLEGTGTTLDGEYLAVSVPFYSWNILISTY